MALILNLDDEPWLLEMNQQLLQAAGHNFMGVTNSHEALRLLRHEPIDLFIQDLCRPDITGEQVYKIMKADPQLGQIPTLIISGNNVAWFQVGIDLVYSTDGFLKKPYIPDMFLGKVAKLLARNPRKLESAL